MAGTHPGDGVLDAAHRGRTPDRSPKMVRGEFKIVGHKPVFGHKPGEVVQLELRADVAHSLMEAGHIAPHNERAEPGKD